MALRMKTGALVATLLVIPMLVLSAWALTGSQGAVQPQGSTILAEPPDYVDGYGFDPLTQTMEDTNGFRYSYQPDGIVQLDLPWGYTTYFSFGLTADYLGSPEQRTALDYTWAWDTVIGQALNETGNLTGYTYTFIATSQDGVMDWEIRLEFSPTSRMKVTHTLTNDYPSDLTNVNFWYLFDLRGTATPYTIETNAGIVAGPLYQEIPDGIYWVRLGNQFQFDWRDVLADYENGHAYIGDGSVIGMSGIPILGISLDIGSIGPGDMVTIDPYFSGVERTWNAAADGLASNPARWSPVGVPATGDNITFDGTSVFNCNWNVEVTLGNFSMLTGYTGTVTQTVDFGLHNYTQTAGTFTPSITYIVTASGSFIKSGGTIGDNLNLIMTGDGNTFNKQGGAFRTLVVQGSTILSGAGTWVAAAEGGLVTIDESKTLTLSSTLEILYPSSIANNGILTGTSKFTFAFQYEDAIMYFGVVNCPFRIQATAGSTADRSVTLSDSQIFGSALEINSLHASYTMNLIGAGYDLTVDGIVTLGTRAIMIQGTGDWTFGSYAQTGEDSVFNQGTEVVIDDSFTVSDGIFNAIGDMTVPGDWDTATGSYLNDDNVVTLTGASNTLAMNAADSFFNVTVSGSYTMDTDTTVRLRATITGELLGTGDFLEPEPEFTSVPWVKACPLLLYDYEVTQTYWDELAIVDAPYWLNVYDGHIKGIPSENETGLYAISLSLTWNDMIVYQNFTLVVCAPAISDYELTLFGVVLSIALGLGLLVIGQTYKMPHLVVFSGFIWLVSAITIYKDISVEWTIITLGLGVMILAGGGFQLVDEG